METYDTGVTSREARVYFRNDERVNGSFFVDAVARDGHEPGSLVDRLNDPHSRYLPVTVAGDAQLVRVDSIAFLAVSQPLASVRMLEAVGATRTPIEFTLESGRRLRGELLHEAGDHRRVSDMLNEDGSRFLILLQAEETLLVHTEAVARIQFPT